MIKLSRFGEDFLKLALRINKHIDGYVDFYIGPETIRQIVDNELKIAPNTLLKELNALLKNLDLQGFDKKRETYLRKMLIAMQTSIEQLAGMEIPFKDLILKLYDVNLKPIRDSEVYKVKKEFEDAYEGTGCLKNRMEKLRMIRAIPPEKVYSYFTKALRIVKEKTYDYYLNLLPKNEEIVVSLIENSKNEIKWNFYEWYLGNYRSRIDVNPNYSIYWSSLLFNAAHEGYPGHHTERLLKELYLFHNKGSFETSILMIYSPEIVISEGMGILAERVLFSPSESIHTLLECVFEDKKIEDSVEELVQQSEIREGFRRFESNLAYYKHVQKRNDEQLIKYAKYFRIIPEVGINAMLEFISDEIGAPYILLYQGERLIMGRFGPRPSLIDFQKLLTQQILPSDL